MRTVNAMDGGACALEIRNSATRTFTDGSVPSGRLPAHLLTKYAEYADSFDSDFVATEAAYFSPTSMREFLTSPTASNLSNFVSQALSFTTSPQSRHGSSQSSDCASTTKMKDIELGRACKLP